MEYISLLNRCCFCEEEFEKMVSVEYPNGARAQFCFQCLVLEHGDLAHLIKERGV